MRSQPPRYVIRTVSTNRQVLGEKRLCSIPDGKIQRSISLYLQQAPGTVTVLKDVVGAWSVFLLFMESVILKRESVSRVASLKISPWGFPGGSAVKSNPPADAGDSGSIPGPGRSHMPRSNQAREQQRQTLLSSACKLQIVKSVHPKGCAPPQERVAHDN